MLKGCCGENLDVGFGPTVACRSLTAIARIVPRAPDSVCCSATGGGRRRLSNGGDCEAEELVLSRVTDRYAEALRDGIGTAATGHVGKLVWGNMIPQSLRSQAFAAH